MKFYTVIDANFNELRNAIVHFLSAPPSTPVEGQFYYNSVSKSILVWNGSAWRPLDAGQLSDGSISIAALATNPLSRANHIGSQLAATISDLAATVQAYRHDQFAAPNVDVSWNNKKLTNLATPTNATDATNKSYVDGALQSAVAGIDSKPSVRVVSVANQALTGLPTIDGVALAANDRVLLTAQTTTTQNGVYVASAGAWSRAVDADQDGEITPGAFWFVEEGTTYGKTQWRCNNTGAIVVGTTPVVIVQFGASAGYVNGNGLALAGNSFSILLDTGSALLVSGTGLKVDTSIVARKFSATLTGNGVLTSFAVTHNLGTKDVILQVRDSADNAVVVDWVATSTTVATVTLGSALANAATLRATVIG